MAARTRHTLEIEGRALTVSNLEKPMFPSGFTKGQAIDFYIRISEWLLPHLKGRPVTLKRYPNGIAGKHFYEKDAPDYTPKWVHRFPVPRRTGEEDICYVLLNDLPSLVWSVNIANLEMHPFLHRAPELERPSAMVFDLDPGEGIGVLECAEVAFLLERALDDAGLQAFPKVSGSKGLQVYVPLNTPVTYAETQPFARGLAERLEREHPKLVISEMAKAKRTGKVFIDWSQNSDFKTTVAPYSMRAKQATPYVSMPVKWEELRAALKKKDGARLYFAPEQALARAAKLGDLFAPVLALQQRLPGASKPAPRAELKFVEPMRAALVAELPRGGEWRYEIKLDGYRAVAIRTRADVRLLSRNNRVLNRRFPRIAAALEALEEGTMLDGEIVALDAAGRPSFNLLQNHQTTSLPVIYYVFDLLAWRGRSTIQEPLSRRRELLEESGVRGLGDPVRISEALEGSPRDLVRAAREQELEGIVAKRGNSIYEPGARSGAWVKYKVNQGQEFVIGGYIPGRLGFESLLVGYYEGRKLMFIGKVKNGFVPRTRQELMRRFHDIETDVCPFANLPEPKNARRGEALTAQAMQKCRWLKPALVARVEYTEITPAKHLRHSRFAGLREDKDARAVVLETAA